MTTPASPDPFDSQEWRDVESWETEVDRALGQARIVLSRATELFLTDTLSDVDIPCALVEAWLQLASAWQERQRHELDLVQAMSAEELEPDEEREEVPV